MKSYPLASTTWGEEEIAAIHEVIESGRFTMGAQVSAFEEEFAEYIGSRYAVMVNSGSSANLALLAASRYRKVPLLQPGDEVLVPAVSWSTTYYPVNQLGARLKFVDINPSTLNIDVAKTEVEITPATKAIFVVNLLGNPADCYEINEIAQRNNLILLEDNCESLGAVLNGKNAGTFGIGGTFSTFFSHHISTMEGGLVVTDDESLFHTLKSIRAHGWTRDLPDINHVHNKTGNQWDDLFRFVLPGYNLRPLEIEAAIGRIQIRKLDSFVEARRENARYFVSLTRDIDGFRIQQETGASSWFGFSLILENKLANHRSELIATLNEAVIESRPIVAGNFTRNPVIDHLDYAPFGELPGADEVHDQGLFIGNHHFDLTEQIDRLASVLDEFQRRY
ncbi:MAG: DegT/DnrJ/EryC1/StrS family aminotransferase [Streptomycetaceae bacterium]|nr:MAG: DegT/DnrJ/EryC1/StrS family aminotransferase [Streptomycetaceae bacterium]